MTVLSLTITCKGPVLTKSSAPGLYGIDSPFAKNRDGQLILPGTLLKGRIRDGLNQLQPIGGDLYDPSRWFGPVAGADGDAANRHFAKVQFGDAVCTRTPPSGQRTRIQLDEKLGAVQHSMMQILESPFGPEELSQFRAIVTVQLDPQECQQFQHVASKALLWTGTLGAQGTVGFGRIEKVEFALHALAGANPAPQPTGERWPLEFRTPDALLVTEKKAPASNLFVGSSIIPGSVLKGAVAAMQPPALLAGYLDVILFTHALPSKAPGIRPVHAPLSLAFIGDSVYDFAEQRDPPVHLHAPPKFRPDWKSKEYEAIQSKVTRWPEVDSELRVRTAIDPDRRRAKDQQLFAYEMIHDRDLIWYGAIDLTAVPDGARPTVASQLWTLIQSGITGVGKMKATLTPASQSWTPAVASTLTADQYFRITLQTPALLTDPGALHGATSQESLFEAYRKYFHDASGGALLLFNFFAQQELQGGKFLYHKFQIGRTDTRYKPYLVTKPGSVFVLSPAQPAEAAKLIGDWSKQGLPPAAFIEEEFARLGDAGNHWKNNPFHRNNGFGEIAVNLVIAPREVPHA